MGSRHGGIVISSSSMYPRPVSRVPAISSVQEAQGMMQDQCTEPDGVSSRVRDTVGRVERHSPLKLRAGHVQLSAPFAGAGSVVAKKLDLLTGLAKRERPAA